jgi:hypothetical protein
VKLLINEDAAYTVIDIVGPWRAPQAVTDSIAMALNAIPCFSRPFIGPDDTASGHRDRR